MTERIKITEMPTKPYLYPFALLAVHKLGGSAKASDVIKEVMNFFNFEENVLEETLPKGGNRLKTYIGFAALDSKKVGYFTDRERGLYQLSEKGRLTIQRLISQNQTESNKIKESISKEISKEVQEYQKEDKKNKESSEISDVDIAGENEKEYLNDLKIIQEMNDPFSFERLCALLFQKVGYEDVETTQRSSDGGYDGFGYLVFGLVRFKVAFQAKKYKKDSKIGPGEIQAFSGTMKQVGAEKGVFITTSDFSQKAKESGLKLGIDLINGEKLIDLLQKHQIGYSQKVEIDKKFFEKL